MSDDVDAIQIRDIPLLKFYLDFRYKVPESTGTCLFCQESQKKRRFCDEECRSDWEQEQFFLSQKPR